MASESMSQPTSRIAEPSPAPDGSSGPFDSLAKLMRGIVDAIVAMILAFVAFSGTVWLYLALVGPFESQDKSDIVIGAVIVVGSIAGIGTMLRRRPG